MPTARFVVSGRVQAVGFRWYTKRQADVLGIRGWVRNCDDGTVECVGSGTDEQLDRFREALERGPRFGKVERVERTTIPHEDDDHKSFDIK